MPQSLKFFDVVGLGFMLCAFFLGAGNIIFPAAAGFASGDNVFYSMVGFLLTGVGLPLLGVMAIAKMGGSLKNMTRYLPPGTGIIASVVLFIIIGPAFATPRTSLVTWEVAVKPLLGNIEESSVARYRLIVTNIFFFIAFLFALSRGRLIDNIGKILMPMLLILLLILAMSVIFTPWGAPLAPSDSYIEQPFATGFLTGYHTMDAFAALMFGGLIVDILREKGITKESVVSNHLLVAGAIAAVGLSLVYISLFWLGATAGFERGTAPIGGAEILSAYVKHLYSTNGVYILAGVVSLACLTTAIGLLGACADYFNSIFLKGKLGYRAWLVFFTLASAWVANVDLDVLISASIPSLNALYPMVITLVLLTFLKPFMKNPKWVYCSVMLISLMMGVLAGLRSITSIQDKAWFPSQLFEQLQKLPLWAQNMEWILPVVVMAVVAFLLDNLLFNGRTEKSA